MLAASHDRLRSGFLLGVVILAAGIGASSRRAGMGHAPEPCPKPAARDGFIVCDGVGAPLRARARLVGERPSLNDATRLEIEAAPGVGPALAAAIVSARAARGGFGSYREVDEVPGIGPKKLAALRARFTLPGDDDDRIEREGATGSSQDLSRLAPAQESADAAPND